jgi:hypothetical protein
MATNLSGSVAELARQIALDQITQDIENEQKFVKKSDQGSSVDRLLTLESKVTELIQKVWAEAPIAPLTLDTTTTDTEQTAFEVRLTALEEKVEELRSKTWKQEALA